MEIKKKRIVFIGGCLDHTNLPFCLKLYEFYKDDFLFINTEKEYSERKALNYGKDYTETPFLFDATNDLNTKQIIKICYDADILIYGGIRNRKLIRKRLRSKKITFKLTERFFKNNKPYGLKSIIGTIYHYYFFSQKNKYVLCMGGYVANDLDRYRLFKNKRFNWGYFTDGSSLTFDELNNLKNKNPNILWVGRFIDVKQPLSVIHLAKYLSDNNLNFNITMVGYGELLDKCKLEVNKYNLSDRVRFTGAISLQEKQSLMDKSNIFIFTSTYGEGWGAVVNEAMSSACLTIGTTLSGSSSALIKQNENGFLYNPFDQKEFNELVKNCLTNYHSCETMRKNAYDTIHNLWNIDIASERLINIFEQLIKENKFEFYESGPCSEAKPFKYHL